MTVFSRHKLLPFLAAVSSASKMVPVSVRGPKGTSFHKRTVKLDFGGDRDCTLDDWIQEIAFAQNLPVDKLREEAKALSWYVYSESKPEGIPELSEVCYYWKIKYKPTVQASGNNPGPEGETVKKFESSSLSEIVNHKKQFLITPEKAQTLTLPSHTPAVVYDTRGVRPVSTLKNKESANDDTLCLALFCCAKGGEPPNVQKTTESRKGIKNIILIKERDLALIKSMEESEEAFLRDLRSFNPSK